MKNLAMAWLIFITVILTIAGCALAVWTMYLTFGIGAMILTATVIIVSVLAFLTVSI